ncbi:MAG: methyltransferase domain-containing protein [Salibacteraceae bacterium]|nr:methyltransferase domain-containing protein [Salibacteraceae bacterium]
MAEEWFETWFDTNYYHLLYKNRDENEARQFIDALLRYLQPKADSHFLDVACGKGRHSIYLHSQGFAATGVDLSSNSISIASKSAEKGLSFFVRDIREPLMVSDVDFALNMFTSFGYFDTNEEHLEALINVRETLKEEGKFVIDYLNLAFVKKHLIEEEIQIHEGVEFRINREITNGFINKSIHVIDGDAHFEFQERVKAFTGEDLATMVSEAGFKIDATFGDYDLNPTSEDRPRVIIIAQNNS